MDEMLKSTIKALIDQGKKLVLAVDLKTTDEWQEMLRVIMAAELLLLLIENGQVVTPELFTALWSGKMS